MASDRRDPRLRRSTTTSAVTNDGDIDRNSGDDGDPGGTTTDGGDTAGRDDDIGFGAASWSLQDVGTNLRVATVPGAAFMAFLQGNTPTVRYMDSSSVMSLPGITDTMASSRSLLWQTTTRSLFAVAVFSAGYGTGRRHELHQVWQSSVRRDSHWLITDFRAVLTAANTGWFCATAVDQQTSPVVAGYHVIVYKYDTTNGVAQEVDDNVANVANETATSSTAPRCSVTSIADDRSYVAWGLPGANSSHQVLAFDGAAPNSSTISENEPAFTGIAMDTSGTIYVAYGQDFFQGASVALASMPTSPYANGDHVGLAFVNNTFYAFGVEPAGTLHMVENSTYDDLNAVFDGKLEAATTPSAPELDRRHQRLRRLAGRHAGQHGVR